MTALYKQQLGQVIAARREELGLTQKELANKAHVAESQTISRWERGERAPQDLEALAAGLQWTVPEMLAQLEPLGQRKLKSMGADEGLTQLDRLERALAEMRVERDAHAKQIEKLLEEQSALLATIRALIGTDGEITLQDRLVQMAHDAAAKAGAPGAPSGQQ